ncbi:hemolysin family protein [Thermomicrobium sp. 4228-Ro]|uniref:hemolysin family protein n=1 Tax=Thermomicrobium sp. 4228-Ro TaxID=2993937 RepID=UPI0022499D7F|nr:hemolysin family protein [Thermomicrobium sp. 4228-Ro]MCX2728335.1 hemolysin family protein [Thermomicrobium sp. 4228-Ro]
MPLVGELLVIVALLAVNGALAAAELAIVSVRRAHLHALAEEGSTAARQVLRLLEEPSRLLATIQVGVTLATFFTSAVGAVSLAEPLASLLRRLPISEQEASAVALVVVTVGLSFASIVLGELVPKTLAVQHAERLALVAARPLVWLSRVASPVVWFLSGATTIALRVLGVRYPGRVPSVTREELLTLLDVAAREGSVSREEARLIEDAFEFGEITVRTVMVPRVDMITVAASMPLAQAVEHFFRTGLSRLPVIGDSPDDVRGVLYIKDVFRIVWQQPAMKEQPCHRFARPAVFVPEHTPARQALRLLRLRRTKIAIVVDEFGGVAGLVTLEDLLERIVGEIADEFDPDYEPLREIAPGVLEVDGRVSLDELLDRLELDEEELGVEFEAESVGGVIIEFLGRFPEVGDTVQLGPLRLEVRSMEGYRVRVVRVTYEARSAE